MYLLPGNPSSHAVEAYRDSGEARCAKSLHTATLPFKGEGLVTRCAFWWTTSCSHASSNAIKTTDRVVAELIAEAKTCSDF